MAIFGRLEYLDQLYWLLGIEVIRTERIANLPNLLTWPQVKREVL